MALSLEVPIEYARGTEHSSLRVQIVVSDSFLVQRNLAFCGAVYRQ
jgi:hypothetical protein